MASVVFFGSPDFALPTLEVLIRSEYRPILVVTQPDRPSGRGLSATPTPVHQTARDAGIEVRTAAGLKDGAVADYLESLKPDFLVVVAFGMILPERILRIPRLECVNVHASLLPAYRGASPINAAVANGDSFTGVSTIRMTERLDAGPVFMQEVEPIDPMEDAGTLSERLAVKGASLLLATLRGVEDGGLSPVEQPGEGVSRAPLLTKRDGLIPWEKPAVEVHNHVRGMNPWPGSHSYIRGRYVKIHRTRPASVMPAAGAPGEVIRAAGEEILVACGAGIVRIERLQVEGKKPLEAGDFLRGFEIGAGERFGGIE
ncbi:MAG: methionyl-tRNA formyltransferase [Candidatus Krumholzibacteria bacterium]|nr:methionyl-tRNA formyltransferase [Candidatus Krumholzibacteria bacterium]